ncbi:MAG: c-type cytochrome [Oligoflexus sp.]
MPILIAILAFFATIACTKKKPDGFHQQTQQASQGAEAVDQQAGEAVVEQDEAMDVKNLPLVQQAVTDHDFLTGLEQDMEKQLQIICSRNQGKTNRVITAFCVDNIRPKSLIELQNALGLNVAENNVPFAITGHSSSLVAKFTSAINPRAIIFTANGQDNNYVVMGFVRGEQFAEIVVNNGQPNTPDYFLVAFTQACNAKPEGCNPGDLLTPEIESNWTGFTLYQDEDLKNTIVDCLHCHQPEGVNSPKILRMQELQNPWTHFFRNNRTGGQALLADYFAAHGPDEAYAGIPGATIANSDPADLEDFVRDNGFADQPNEFQTNNIETDVEDTAPGQPQDNTTPGQSAQWEEHYQAHVRGEVIAPPYHDVKVTEPSLLQKYTQQYQDYRAGLITKDQFEDHREIFKLDPVQKANMGFGVRPDADGQTIITQACAQCHNSKLDQSLSRAKFNVDLAAMGANAAAEIDIAIQRLQLGYSAGRRAEAGIKFYNANAEEVELDKGEHLLTMPPRRFKDLTDEQIDAAIQYLQGAKAQFQ